MSKEKVKEFKTSEAVANVVPSVPSMPPVPPTAPNMPAPQEKMDALDKAAFDLARANKELFTARMEIAALNYKNVILQLYMKYGLNQNDAIGEDGTIVRGGMAAYAQQQAK